MEFVFATRGHIDCVEKFIRNLRSTWLKYEFTSPEGLQARSMEMNIKPIQLWDIAFPKEYLDVILATLIKDREQHDKDMKKRYGFLWTFIKQARKFLKLKPIPKYKGDQKFPIYTENIEIFPVGIKEDENMLDANGKVVEGI